jgi:dTDP-4-dehydrorhamnose reductase
MAAFLKANKVDFRGFNRDNLDLNHETPGSLGEKLLEFDVVVNCVGYTAVDKAEIEPDKAIHLNGTLPGVLANACLISGSRLAHISTDYVFDGANDFPYLVTDKTNPVSVYGISKAMGERNIESSGVSSTIFRSAWLYAQNSSCFPLTIANRLVRGQGVKVVDDQWGQPTWAQDLAAQIFSFMSMDSSPSIVHAVSSGKTNWYEFASEIARSLNLKPSNLVIPVSSGEFPTAATRPAWSVLDNSSDLVEPIGDWRERWLVAADEILGSR